MFSGDDSADVDASPRTLQDYAEDEGWLERGQPGNDVACDECLYRVPDDEVVALEDDALPNGFLVSGEVITTHFCTAGGWAEQLANGSILASQEE